MKQLAIIRHLLAMGKRLLLWGKGAYSSIILDYLRENGIQQPPLYLIDDAYWKEESTDSIPFSAYIQGETRDDAIIFGFYDYGIILEKKAAWGAVLPHLFDFHLTAVQGKRLRWDAQSAEELLEDYRQTYALLEDDRSRLTMQRYLDAATAGEFDRLYRECRIPKDYFNEITEGLKPDTLIDCGAFDGDSIHDFVRMFPNYKRLIAFEPDPGNAALIRRREKSEGLRELCLFEKGVYSDDTVLRFLANGESDSFMSESGSISVEVCRLDGVRGLIQGTAFLKMDIEGSELEALRGAERLIRENRPILAICVYHRERDLIDIPRFIHSVAGKGVYRYYLGFHGRDLAELCFYAIPTQDACRE